MNRKVARWEDLKGSSRGAWLLQDMPGCLMIRDREGWKLETVGPNSLSLSVMGEGPKRTWGSWWDYKAAIDFKLDNPEMGRIYRTREDLLDAVEMLLALRDNPPRGELSGLISE